MEGSEKKVLEDARLEVVGRFAVRSLRLKAEKWAKLTGNEDNFRLMTAGFLDDPEQRVMVVCLNQLMQLVVHLGFPVHLKSKAVFFVRRLRQRATLQNLAHTLAAGDLATRPAHQLDVLVDTVLVSLLASPWNQQGWPGGVAADVTASAYALRDCVQQTLSEARGETLLPMPHVLDAPDLQAKGAGDNVKGAVEATVAKWVVQVGAVLQQESSTPKGAAPHPGPAAEIAFWRARQHNLEVIVAQLQDERVHRMALFLAAAHSPYHAAFTATFKNLITGLSEATAIATNLGALERFVEAFCNAELPEAAAGPLKCLVRLLCLVWAHCPHVRKLPRLLTLLRQLANLLVQQAKAYIDANALFQDEVEDVYIRINNVLAILDDYKKLIEAHKPELQKHFQPEWELSPSMVFARVDAFKKRLLLLKEVFWTAIEFRRLERVELEGSNGRQLTLKVAHVLRSFEGLLRGLRHAPLDPLEPDEPAFDAHVLVFRKRVDDLERRLAVLFCHALDECHDAHAIYKFIDVGASLLERPLVTAEVALKLERLLDSLDAELAAVEGLVAAHKGQLVTRGLDKNVPPVAGTLMWSRKLRLRVQDQLQTFFDLDIPLSKCEKARALRARHGAFLEQLAEWEERLLGEWAAEATALSHDNLLQPLLLRRPNKELALNFHPQLVSVLREVHYLIKLGVGEKVPATAMGVYARNETLRQFSANLNLATNWYNRVRKLSQPVELRLLEREVRRLDADVDRAQLELNWDSAGVWEFVVRLRDAAQDLEARLRRTQKNVCSIRTAASAWAREPLHSRGRSKNPLPLPQPCDHALLASHKRFKEVVDAGKEINRLMAENKSLFHRSEEGESDDEWLALWGDYEDFIDEIVSKCLQQAVGCSLNYLLEEMSPRKGQTPLFEVKLELVGQQMVFRPELESEFPALIDTLLEEIAFIAKLVPRVSARRQHPHYAVDVDENCDIKEMNAEICSRVAAAVTQAVNYTSGFENYSYLWLEDKSAFLLDFLASGLRMAADEEQLDDQQPPQPPTIAQFKEQIDAFASVQEEVGGMAEETEAQGWLRVDLRPFKQSVVNESGQWGALLMHHLEHHVRNTLSSLAAFVVEAEAGLQAAVKDDDYLSLVSVMSYLRQIKSRLEETDGQFAPLRETLQLLAQYEHEMPEEIHVLLEELPQQWRSLKHSAEVVRQQVAPLRSIQQGLIRRRMHDFEARQAKHYDTFKRSHFFRYECQNPYELLDGEDALLSELEAELFQIKDTASLFEVPLNELKPIASCRREMKLVKHLWDFIGVVRSSIKHWKTTPWKKIDVENMDIDCKKFAKEIKMMDKEVRQCDAYLEVEATVRNMITSLRAVAELQNPAIRERHWHQLMAATKVHFMMDERTTLNELLGLQLHQFEDEVRGIVEQAIKERGMEGVLRDLDETWRHMRFERDPLSGCNALRASEELIETLEENQVQLQNLMSSKYIAFFLREVSAWQQRLSNADQVISVWFDVQRTWLHLNSIFTTSDDIRQQLPQDSDRFYAIDTTFRRMLSEMPALVIEATNQPGLYEQLEGLQGELTLCEKALAEYLETKRLAFPRFYFVSSLDLLDILSNGNHPLRVTRHLTKLFDSMAYLTFREVHNLTDVKDVATAMIAKDGELVNFHQDFHCRGPVEVWLSRLEKHMRGTMREYLERAVLAYEEKPREQWLFDFPAQVSLCGSQVWWTAEVAAAFARLEEGYENALKDYQRKQVSQLNTLISLLLGELSKQQRQKIMTLCTIDVHARDVVSKLVQLRVESASAFPWQSQLRHRWDGGSKECFINICDAQFGYAYEYLGNTPRLVITPLTDRCYITLTQSLHLVMGGAPAGPAGTGKTETTKDLGRALGIMVYVFNCSEQMDYQSCGNIYKGLAQTGAWGCFDEFNRISVEVLSVVAVQVKSLLDAIREQRPTFNFQGGEISLVPSVGIFVTMNPGYAGRTELPENLKALFRPCAMVVPDFELICEIMLVAEGFQEARVLARKFITLYSLCRELLSKQDHYDWGLRAIKSVLVVAGSLKRGDRERPEEQVLMRALRDFNIPKIVADDTPVFMGLIGDLFPALDVPRKRDLDFERGVKQAAADLHLQPEDNFILKVVQLEELLQVRHSVFIVGAAGSGKTQVWKTLSKTHANMKRRPVVSDLNPKAVTNDELFGVINPTTREWKDGLFSSIMRDQANMPGENPKWIVMDGDIDPMWIESLNTVMDDNKILTLASNERIAVTPTMRLLFEISNLRNATPATVSRAGILYLNPQDLGWSSFVSSWLEGRGASEKTQLQILFDKYLPNCVEMSNSGRFKPVTAVTTGSQVATLCRLLECLLTPTSTPSECPAEWLDTYFVFACVWAFGGALAHEQAVEFSKWWQCEFKTTRLPADAATVFCVFVHPDTRTFAPWTDRVPKFELDPELPLLSTLVATPETTRLAYFLDLLLARRHPVALVGAAGVGKSVLVNDRLAALPDHYLVANVPFNYYTTSEMLQKILEKPLEKKAGRNYGPPGSKKLVYFIDDFNMPEVDAYGTVQPHTLVRQHLDYGHWYDRTRLSVREIHNVQYVACMNPTAGSFTINPRLQRHFSVLAVSMPSDDALAAVYAAILQQHVAVQQQLPPPVLRVVPQVVAAALNLHARASQLFLPTANKFHYTFNLRDISNVFQGLLFSTGDSVQSGEDLARLWVHETHRVYGDKMADDRDCDTFSKLLTDICKKCFEDMEEGALTARPNIYCHFAGGLGESRYLPVPHWDHLAKLLSEALANYNELVSAMQLVLFEDAMMHVCRINRILESPRGNALLVGVGGSGKQSLARLAAFISGLEVFQVQLRQGYAIADLKVDLASLYLKAGLKNVGTAFIMTDAQVADERFLVLINDLLASGEVPELFTDDEVDNIVTSLRNEVKGLGLSDTRDNCWRFFIERVRRQLKVVLCFSPVGSTLRVRSRKFPALTGCSSIVWFHEWPKEALISVSKRFLNDLEVLKPEVRESAAEFLAQVHTSVTAASHSYASATRRFYYTTPKSYLEQIWLYSKILREKDAELRAHIARLENGLEKLRSTAAQVDGLKRTLALQEVEVQNKNDAADKLIHRVAVETEKVSKEKILANKEEAKVAVIAKEVAKKQQDCEADLVKAEPALVAAMEALNTLNKANLTELKSFGSPPEAVTNVTAAVMVLLSPDAKIPKDRSWKAAKMMMGKVDAFLDALVNYKKEEICAEVIKAIQPYLKDKEFKPELIRSKSAAAAGLCAWVINIIKFFEVFCEVEPKRVALADANAELAAAQHKLTLIKQQIQSLEGQLAQLTGEFETATQEKMQCQREADQTNKTIDLANRLVNGLASEKIRWAHAIDSLRGQATTLPGDVLVVSAFVSYVGGFNRKFRQDLLRDAWLPYFKKLQPSIAITEDLDPLSLLTDDAKIAAWNNEGLPSDRMSTENATILTNSQRWPLMIDPQLQGLKWVKSRFGSELLVLRSGQKGYLESLEGAITSGRTTLMENLGESVDAVLEPLLSRNLTKKGRAIRIGDKEVEYHPNFRLILHTKLGNPHYKPEMQAQTTLIDFTVTKDGLEEQLLAEVVRAERPDLEHSKAELTKQQNEFKIRLKDLEDALLLRLSSAGGDLLSDQALVENLETTKKTAADISKKVAEGKVTARRIDEARESYRCAARRAALLYFILNELNRINPVYQFSLKAFSVVFQKAIERAAPARDHVARRVDNLIDCITFSIFLYTSRGLFECDKLIFAAQMAFQILVESGEVQVSDLDMLLRFPSNATLTSPFDFLSNSSWGAIKSLSQNDEFRGLDRDIESSATRWKKFVEGKTPERDKFPQEWKTKTAVQRLCMIRALRPDRLTYALSVFIEESLGAKYVKRQSVNFEESFEETGPATPIFFILSPGVNPLKEVEELGVKLGFSASKRNFHSVSLGQGQEVVAERALAEAAANGHWVVLQNIHLVRTWLGVLEKKLEQLAEDAHPHFRLFMSAEPAPKPANHILPQGLLEASIKITNEPPAGMQANLLKALNTFSQDTLEMCSKEAEFKQILFGLCYFHAVVAERRKFGPQGWNRVYPFNIGDLTISMNVLYNYLEANTRVPWEDLRYLFGEIMYGGHITDDWDRRLCRTYLEEIMQPDLVEGELELAAGFTAPPNTDMQGMQQWVLEALPAESPQLYGLHTNAEIGFMTATSEALLKTVFEMQPRDAGILAGGATISREDKVKVVIDELLDKLPEVFNMTELNGRVEERTPYIIVACQECERINLLTEEMRRSLKELDLGLKGELTITADMEELEQALFLNQVPQTWAARAYPSLQGLAAWFADLLLRLRELETWTTDFVLPASVWLSGFFNPQSFLTAIMQSTARKNEWPLDKMCLHFEVTKKHREDVARTGPREGAFVHGLFMEGARWDSEASCIADSRLKELFPPMPVIAIKAITQDKQDLRGVYQCPMYKTRARGPTYVWTFNLRSRERSSKWTLAGVALLLQV
ncbi:dynein beta chain, ciliary-like isoform X3 [Neocloeon triangulifer]|uniref:dynein beta chain, ciliary-like isoform X3 n=1 Tax=Neocloeon triangulifer TaxID=2078957 RepID=UPI00286F8512|nr:dynein beta chain, ciliary-like isoform X3 [Neocloeon triangulifer]